MAQRRQDAVGDRHQACRRSVAPGVMMANSSPPSRATSASPRTMPRRRLVTAAISSSPDVMAERVVDVLEVIEVDAEDGGRRAALLDVGDHRFEALAEIGPVGQPRQRVMHREMPQLVFALRDPRRGAAHVAQGKPGEEREPAERDHDERDDACRRSRPTGARRPGETRRRRCRKSSVRANTCSPGNSGRNRSCAGWADRAARRSRP